MSTEERNWELVMANADIVRALARFAWHRMWLSPERVQFDFDDLYQTGLLVAYNAAEVYDPDKGASFGTFMTFRVRGAMIDLLYPDRRRQYAGEGPGKTGKVSKQRAMRMNMTSLEALTMPEADARPLQIVDVRNNVREMQEWLEADELFKTLWQGMTGREKELLYDRIVREEPLRYTAAKWGVTESRACQIRNDLKRKVLAVVA